MGKRVKFVSFHDDSQMVFSADRGFQIIYSDLFESTFVFQTVSSTDNKRQKKNDIDDKTFTFLQKSPWRPAFIRRMSPSSPPRTGSSCKIHLKLSLSTNKRRTHQATLTWGFAKQPLSLFPKIPQDPSTPPTPSRLLLPGYSPPLRPPAGLQVGQGWGDLLSLFSRNRDSRRLLLLGLFKELHCLSQLRNRTAELSRFSLILRCIC